MSDAFKVESDDLDRLSATLYDIQNLSFLVLYSDFYRYFRVKTQQRYQFAARNTPYATSSLGRKQRHSGKIMGQDALFGIDSEALYKDLTQRVKITADGLNIYSDQPYAAYILDLYRQKGPYSPNDILFMDDEDFDEIELAIERRVIQAIDINFAKAAKKKN